MTRIPLTLGKHFLLIDSPISFFLIDNEENSVYRPSGVWQLDTWKLLPETYQKDHPVYTLSIEYDESKLIDGKEVLIRTSDIDLGDGVAGVSGQAVQLTGINDSLLPIPVTITNRNDIQRVRIEDQPVPVYSQGVLDIQGNVSVNNIPDVQKVNVQNAPTSIAVSNIPDVQKVYVSLYSLCGIPSGEPLNFAEFLNFLDTHPNYSIDCLVLSFDHTNYLMHVWSITNTPSGSKLFSGIGRNFTDNSLKIIGFMSSGASSWLFIPYYHSI